MAGAKSPIVLDQHDGEAGGGTVDIERGQRVAMRPMLFELLAELSLTMVALTTMHPAFTMARVLAPTSVMFSSMLDASAAVDELSSTHSLN